MSLHFCSIPNKSGKIKSMKFSFRFITTTLLAIGLGLSLLTPSQASAQSSGLYYTAKEGDSLHTIALAFHTSTNRILSINYLEDPNTLTPGRRIRIPGFEDVQGEVIQTTLPFGESFATFLKRQRLPEDLAKRLFFITNEDAYFGGETVYVINTESVNQKQIQVWNGMTDLELAVKQGVNRWAAADYNGLKGTWDLLPNDILFLPTEEVIEAVDSMRVTPALMLQGKTIRFNFKSVESNITAKLGDLSLHFIPTEPGQFEALQGIPRMQKPGLLPMVVTITYADSSTFTWQNNMLVKQVDYGLDAELEVADNFVDPEVTAPELEWLVQTTSDAPVEKMWNGILLPPSPTPECLTSTFGRLRSYNGSPFEYFHSGIDYCGGESTPILAAANGVVVFAGEKTVRGNATILSHGRGVYTGYWHQSRIDVQVGDVVQAGQTIGMVGATGRVTGPHLHFEVLVGGVQVDPADWLDRGY